MEKILSILKKKRVETHLILSLSFVMLVLYNVKSQESELTINELFVKGFILIIFLISFAVHLNLYVKNKNNNLKL